MPVFKQGDRYTYIPPTPYACELCGVSIVAEYGLLDAEAYEDGFVFHHHCDVRVEPLNQRQWQELMQLTSTPSPPPPPLPYRTRLPAQRLDETWLL